jgi:pimeloyl-ACP methyl ester carboxylesterase
MRSHAKPLSGSTARGVGGTVEEAVPGDSEPFVESFMSEETETGPQQVMSPDSTNIAYWSSGHGPPLLLVHGSMSDHRRWRITSYLTPHRTVHAMDRRGRGGSGDGPVWSPDREVEDVVAVIDALADHASGPVDVLGHSLGGYLALRAAGHTSKVRRLVLYEPAIVQSPQPAELVARMQQAADANRYEDVVELMVREVLGMPEEEIAMLRSLPSWPARVATAPTLPREVSVRLVPAPDELSAITAPTLLIQGADSPAFLHDAVRSVTEALPGAQVVSLEGHQHVADQTDPEMFARIVLDFILD